jgi:tRNA threonylcarbamoyladenosine biosynthesis protein TsaB
VSERLLLVIDTATRSGVIGLAASDGRLLAADTWTSAHRHGEELLSRLDALLARQNAKAEDLGAVIVGTGPGSFTGLRIGLATAKTLAYGLDIPLLGISTAHALALAADGEVIVTLPAGARDRYLVRVRVTSGQVEEVEPARLVGSSVEAPAGAESVPVVAVDFEPSDVSRAAWELGRHAVDGLAASLARLGAAALAGGRRDDVAELVPAYVALPRGIAEAAASVEWSPDLR